MTFSRRSFLIIFLLATVWGTMLALLIDQPGYTDAYYYFNAGQRLVQGKGLTDPYLWTYINAPDHLPGPSHAYWMPLESLVAASSMMIFGANFGAAQIPAVLCFAGLVTASFWLGGAIGHTRRYAYLTALLVLFSGFYTPFWTTTDTFALYGLIGVLALIMMGKGRATGNWRWYAAGGGLSALAHLTRADGLLLLIVLAICALWPHSEQTIKQGMKGLLVGIAAYLLIMLPWLVRNLSELGTPLPTGGTQTIWLKGYNELVNYPAGTSAHAFLNWGLGHILQSRWEALIANLGTFVAVETWVILGPFALVGLWRCRRNPLCFGALFYALGLHLAMTFVFAYPGYRGGLFHSSAVLLPFWAICGLMGLDQGIGWMAKRRRWHKTQAQMVFSSALILLAILLSVGILLKRATTWNKGGDFYQELAQNLPANAVVMINDPAALYYHTKLSGVVVPNANPDVVPILARRYGVTYLVLDKNRTAPFSGLYLGTEQRDFLRDCKLIAGDKRVCAIDLSQLSRGNPLRTSKLIFARAESNP